MTRAFLLLAHGDLSGALRLNPNSLWVFGLVVALWCNEVSRLLHQRELILVLTQRGARVLYVAIATLMVFTWVYNALGNPWIQPY